MDPQMNDEPRYGRRSPEAVAPAPDQSAQGPAQTPWPQYGRVDPAGNPPYGAYSGAAPLGTGPAAPGAQGSAPSDAPQYGAAPSGYGAQAASSGPQPYGSPYAAPGAYQPPRPLPGRGGPIASIVIGIVVALLIAPISLFLGVLGGLNIDSMMKSMTEVTSGQTVTVDRSGAYLVATQSTDVYSCSLTGAGGEHAMESVGTGSFFASNLQPGDYALACRGEGPMRLMGLTGLSADQVTNAGLAGLAWGTSIGLLGVILSIIGIVWLVRVNRRRNAIRRGAPGY